MRTVFGCLLALVCVAPGAAQELPPARGVPPRLFGDGRAVRRMELQPSTDVTHYRLRIEFDLDKQHIVGVADIQLTALQEQRELVLHFGDLTVDSVALARGPELTHGYDPTTQLLRMELPAPLKQGEAAALRVRYHGTPRAGLHFTGPDDGYPDKLRQCWSQGQPEFNRHWFPCWDKPNDFATFETIFVVPDGYTAVGNGRLVKREPDGAGRTAWHWAQEFPHATYLTSVVVGELHHKRLASEKLQLDCYVPKGWPDADARIERAFGRTAEMVAFMERYFGVPYPSPKYAQTCVIDFLSGGMENTSATTLTTTTLMDARAALDWSAQDLVMHELAHQWFGDLVTCRDWPHLWLNEGFATYIEALWVRASEGEAAFRRKLDADLGWYWHEHSGEYARPVVTDRYAHPGELFDGHTYSKGGRVLAMLHTLLGDAAFRAGCKAFLESFRHRPATTGDFRAVMEHAHGKPLGWFFDQWLRKPGYPELEIDVHHDAEAQELVCTVTQAQDRSSGTPLYRLPCVLAVTHGERCERTPLLLTQESQTFRWPMRAAPDYVRFDPDGTLLAGVTFQRSTEMLIAQLQREPSVWGKVEAAWDLGSFHVSNGASAALAREALTKAQAHPDAAVRAAAAWALGQLGPRAVPALLTALRDPASRVRTAAVAGLAQASYGDGDRVAGPLLERWRTDDSYRVRAQALRALARVNAEGTAAAALQGLQVESHREVIRLAALDALFEAGHTEARRHALAATRYGRPPDLRAGAVGVLARQAGSHPETTKRLIALCVDRDHHVRLATARALVTLRPPEAARTLHLMSRRETDAELRAVARRALLYIAHRLPPEIPEGK